MKSIINRSPLAKVIIGSLILVSAIHLLSGTVLLLLRSDGVVVDVAGRNRMLSQRLILHANLYLKGQEESKEIFIQSFELHDVSLTVMKEGGIAPGIKGNKIIQPASPEILPHLEEIDQVWLPLKKQVNTILSQPLYSAEASLDTGITKNRPINPRVMAALEVLEKEASRILTLNDQLVKAYVKQSQTQTTLGSWVLLLGLLLSLVTLFLIVRMLKKAVIRPLTEIKEKAEEIAQGNYQARASVQGVQEINQVSEALGTIFHKFHKASKFVQKIGEGDLDAKLAEENSPHADQEDSFFKNLSQMKKSLRQNAHREKQQKWQGEGSQQINVILRESEGLKEMGDRLIAKLVKYLEANQGGIFIKKESDNQEVLSLLAMYAYNRKKFLTKEVLPGEGLIGQVYLEGEKIYMSDIPKEYLQVTSGLGDCPPRYLVIIPLTYNEKTEGILEIASFHPFSAYALEWLDKIGESIGSSLARLKNVGKIERLLSEAQSQTELLRAQEEEIRQNMEELAATQEQMARKEKEMREMVRAMNATVISAEYDAQGNLLKVNGKFLEIFGGQAEDWIGKSYKQLGGCRGLNASELWDRLSQGQTQLRECEVSSAFGKTLLLKSSFTPVFNDDQELVKVIQIAQDKSEHKNNHQAALTVFN